MEQTGSPRFLAALTQMVRESDPKARGWVFRAITKLKRAAAHLSGAPRLRVHLTGASIPVRGPRTIWAAIASPEGREIPNLPATSVLLWEDLRIVSDYSVQPLERPQSMALALVLPLGEAGDRMLEALSALKRDQDRWQECRYWDLSTANALEQAFTFLATASANRYMIFVAPPGTSDQQEAQSASVRATARGASVSVQIIPDDPEDPGRVTTACEKVYLSLLCGYEIVCQTSAGASDPSELKLEVSTAQGYGADVLKAPDSGWRSAALARRALAGAGLRRRLYW
jgi:hypothetical protein